MSTEDTPDSDEPRHPYETEDSFHPLGSEWEDDMRDKLEETDYDADLGMQMARDAQRLVAGELSEEEFYAEYHDDVKDEFETDERPVFDDLDGVNLDDFEDESLLESLADVDLNADEVSRREMMSKMGAAGLFLGYSAFATYDNDDEPDVPEQVSGIRPADEDDRDHRWGMTIDLERCDGCLACVTGCINENGTSTGANWMYVFAYDDNQSEQENFLVRPCQHCSNAPCAKVCPVRARHTREKDGLVLTNYETCIGCRYCQVACPYGVNYFQWGEPDVDMNEIMHTDLTPPEVRDLDFDERQERLSEDNDHAYDERGWWTDSRPPNGVMGKCTMCPSRQDNHTDNPKGTVACMDACDSQGMSAIHFGDLDAEVGDEYDRAVRYLEERTEKSEQEDVTNKFQADLSIDAEVGFNRGYYGLHLVEREPDDDEWRVFDSAERLVASTPLEASSEFGDSSIGSFGTLPSAELQVLYSDETTEIPTTLVFDGDFPGEDEAEPLDVTASLRLDNGETLATQQLTLEEDAPEADLTFTVESSDVTSDEGAYVMYLVVDSEVEEEERAAAQQGTYVTMDRPNVATADSPYQGVTGRSGELVDVPDVLFQDIEEQEIGVSIEYPSTGTRDREIALILFDGTAEDTIGQIDYTFEQRRTSNTAWDSKISTFKLLEDIGTEPNITYIGNEPGPKAEQKEGPVAYEQLTNNVDWDVEVKDNRKEHLDYGPGGPSEEEA